MTERHQDKWLSTNRDYISRSGLSLFISDCRLQEMNNVRAERQQRKTTTTQFPLSEASCHFVVFLLCSGFIRLFFLKAHFSQILSMEWKMIRSSAKMSAWHGFWEMLQRGDNNVGQVVDTALLRTEISHQLLDELSFCTDTSGLKKMKPTDWKNNRPPPTHTQMSNFRWINPWISTKVWYIVFHHCPFKRHHKASVLHRVTYYIITMDILTGVILITKGALIHH